MRKIMLLVSKTNVSKLCVNDAYKVKYHEIKQEDEWKVPVLKELTNVKYNSLDLEGFSPEELDNILSDISSS